jgi:hypothetical protein
MDSTRTPSVTNGVIWSVFVRSTRGVHQRKASNVNQARKPRGLLVQIWLSKIHDSPLDLTGKFDQFSHGIYKLQMAV